jgi:hypothetical protein
MYFDTQDSHIIGAIVFIASMIDAAFDLPLEHKGNGQFEHVENLPTSPQKTDSAKKKRSVDSKSDASP